MPSRVGPRHAGQSFVGSVAAKVTFGQQAAVIIAQSKAET